jgi:3-deoxy-D-manno-oct-2-ulosonic acid (Kdo) hydroxylase
MTVVAQETITQWTEANSLTAQQRAVNALEDGCVLYLPRLKFALSDDERQFMQPVMKGNRKNISYDALTGELRGGEFSAGEGRSMRAMMERYATSARSLIANLLPQYQDGLIQGRTSFRPVEIVGRVSSWRQDDTRLHVDSFPSSPVHGQRIFRVFSNVNPHGKGRSWRIGEPFETVARRYLPVVPRPMWGSSLLLQWLRITKRRRSRYDHFMLQLHDRMKHDLEYQKNAQQTDVDFPAGSTWLVFTDQVSHAAMAGQYCFEQTYYLPVSSMADASKSPLRVLERILGEALV